MSKIVKYYLKMYYPCQQGASFAYITLLKIHQLPSVYSVNHFSFNVFVTQERGD